MSGERDESMRRGLLTGQAQPAAECLDKLGTAIADLDATAQRWRNDGTKAVASLDDARKMLRRIRNQHDARLITLDQDTLEALDAAL